MASEVIFVRVPQELREMEEAARGRGVRVDSTLLIRESREER